MTQTADEAAQAEVLALLRDPATHGGETPQETVTHSARVFLAGETALKIKRALRYDYLDFSTVERRRAVLRRELELNRRAAPMLYRRVAEIARGADGSLALDGESIPVEPVLVMRRFPAEAELSRIAERGTLDRDLAQCLGRMAADYHADAPRREADGAELISAIVEELSQAFAGMKGALGAGPVAAYDAALRAAFQTQVETLRARGQAGRVRRCHGDLHLRNIVLIDGRPVPFDALEFDETLGTCDTAYDFAFLVMDMCHRGLAEAANAAFNAYFGATDDPGALAPWPLFLSIRAAIHAMTGVQQAGPEADAEALAGPRAYLAEARAYLAAPPPRLLAVGGVSGTGKTTVARALAPLIGAAPGALHLRSDTARKALFEVPPTERLGDEAYTPAVSRRVHETLAARARTTLAAGHSVIVDATFVDAEARAAVQGAATDAGVPAVGLWLEADPAVLADRIRARTGDASDATPEVMRAQARAAETPEGWHRVEAGGTVADTIAAACTMLGI